MATKTAKILIVEDDPNLLDIYATTFKNGNFEVITASNGEDGFELMRENKPSIMLLDILLPGKMNGLKVLEEIKKVPEIAGIPVMILSNLEDDKTISEGLKLGASGYFIKSQANPDDVVRNVQTLIG